MPKYDYAMAQIYLVKSKAVKNDGWIYVGSSCRDLPMVFAKHMHESKRYAREGKSNVLYDKIRSAWDFYHLVLYENHPCQNINQLRQREEEVCALLGGVSRITSKQIKKENRAKYYQEHKEKIAEKVKAYYETHKREKRNAYFREYRARKKASGLRRTLTPTKGKAEQQQ